jgi:two-component system, NarL family, nitrate/nitrite response regulator NarL
MTTDRAIPTTAIYYENVNDHTSIAKARVAIVEDHSMVADGLARIISDEEDFCLVGVAATVADALALVEREDPDVVLMDYHLPDGNGVEATKEILKRWPRTKILMLSGGGGHDLVARAIESGCSGFLAKTRPSVDFVAGVRAAARGELVLRSDDLADALGAIRSSTGGNGMTPRELDVLRHLAKGESTDDIAVSLYVSVSTVRNHIQNVLMKLNAHSKLAAVAIAARQGLISLDEIG